MTASRFPNMPDRMKSRPVDHRGFPVPWFVTRKTPEGHWDFVNIMAHRTTEAWDKQVCSISGAPLGKHVAFAIGPMCIINRISAEPPNIPEMAHWAATVCPFMSRPLAGRAGPRPENSVTPGIMVEDNPGGVVIWTVARKNVIRRHDKLFTFGDPEAVDWYVKGRKATPLEANLMFEKRAAALLEIAKSQGKAAVEEFWWMIDKAIKYVPIPDLEEVA